MNHRTCRATVSLYCATGLQQWGEHQPLFGEARRALASLGDTSLGCIALGRPPAKISIRHEFRYLSFVPPIPRPTRDQHQAEMDGVAEITNWRVSEPTPSTT